jgi:hypothetical protein
VNILPRRGNGPDEIAVYRMPCFSQRPFRAWRRLSIPGVGTCRRDKRYFAFHAGVDKVAGVSAFLANGFFAVPVDAVALEALGGEM